MNNIKWYSTTEKSHWQELTYAPSGEKTVSDIQIGTESAQTIDGFGACFNELCEIALEQLPKEAHEEVMDLLYDPSADGLRLNFCRMPIGASDYAAKWYSYNETDGDYAMEHFSIDGDRKYLLPMIRSAYSRGGDIKLFASPWSPPSWMKDPPVYNFGRLVDSDENLAAYALYLARFTEAYEKEGIHIDAVHVQNEPFADQKFPSCLWTGELFVKFIGKYLGPTFKKRGITTKIFLGTINSETAESYDKYVNAVLTDPDASSYVEGIGMQWMSRYMVPFVQESWPEVYTVQTENECGDGNNDWDYAKYIFNLFRHYLTYGVRAYTYWNPVLANGGMSTWGWRQNSMISVADGHYTLNHEYYVMKHFSRFIKRGAVRIPLHGHWTSDTAAFRNPDGQIVVVTQNPFEKAHTVHMQIGEERYDISLPADSINTLVIG